MKFNVVQSAMEPLVKHLRKPGRLITVTILSSICINLFVGEQYLSVILPGRAFKPAFDKIKHSPLALSRVLEDGGSVINYLGVLLVHLPLLPWAYLYFNFCHLHSSVCFHQYSQSSVDLLVSV